MNYTTVKMKIDNNADRCVTGVQGLDEILDGGFPRGRTILLSGACGTGKTILSTQFLYNGIIRYNEPGVLLMLEQNVEYLKRDMMAFNCNLTELEESGKLVIIDASLSKFHIPDSESYKPPHDRSFSLTSMDLIRTKELVDILIDTANEIGAKRVVIDSLPALNNLIRSKTNVRDVILNMNYRLQANGLTSILISDLTDEPGISVEEYISDGAIILKYIISGPDAGRNLIIQKMRGTKHSEHIHPTSFKQGYGIVVQGLDYEEE